MDRCLQSAVIEKYIGRGFEITGILSGRFQLPFLILLTLHQNIIIAVQAYYEAFFKIKPFYIET